MRQTARNTIPRVITMASELTGIIYPILSDDTTLSLDFGNTYSDGSLHKGIDVYSSLKRECDIIAPCDGTVTSAVNNVKGTNKNTGTLGMGNYVYLQTDKGYRVRFQHMKYGSVVVKKNQAVKKGQKIGIIGNTGNSTGRHLHFDVSLPGNISGGRYVSSQNRTYFDPKPFLRGTKPLTKEKQPEIKGERYAVGASVLNVRSGPGTNYTKVKKLTRGTIITVYEIKNDFGRIGEGMWCSMEYLRRSDK